MSEIISLFGTSQIQIIVILIAVDVVLGIIAALVKKNFAFGKLSSFMKGPILAYVFGFVVIEIVREALPQLAFVVPVVFVLVVISLLASIIGNLGKLFGFSLPVISKK